MANILLFGRDGQLGRALFAPLSTLCTVTALGRTEADFNDPEMVRATIRDLQPQVIVNATAYTAVDRAESEPQIAMTTNAVSVGVLGEAAARIGARIDVVVERLYACVRRRTLDCRVAAIVELVFGPRAAERTGDELHGC